MKGAEMRLKVDQKKKKEYTARIAQANRSELVVIIYELFLVAMEDAEESFAKGELSEGVRYVKRAEGFLQELMGSLDRRYVYEQLIFSVIRQKLVNGETVKEVMGKLKEAFIQVAKEDKSSPVMENTQQIYAGLTYGKGSLNEVLLKGNESNRGYWV